MALDNFISDWQNANPFLHVHTSGSTGKPKDLLVEKKRMEASARMTCDFLELKPGDTALLCMPLDYIAGKMVVVRSIVRNLNLISVEPTSMPLDLLAKEYDGKIPHINFAAMVPLQVIKSLDNPLLRDIDNLIIGGGAISPEIEAVLREFPKKVWSTYGMTETLSHVALRPISGPQASLWYTPLPGVKVSLNADSCLVIDAPLVCKDVLVTNDIAEFDDKGRFRIKGRKDNVINSGAIKIQIEEVEDRLRDISGGKYSFQITSCSDPTFGEVVVLLLQSSISEEIKNTIENDIQQLPKYWQPKRVKYVDALPLTETGKPNRAEAKRLAYQ
ncbi:MAG: AMP-binding protein [Bacteroidaceae bacterium]|nr:AMP-binding protein [Bacteroidaceae bacterium]